ncbi:hypothetical protein HOK51_00795 [Candidatus Woesearchaeota archaeon]|jgi:hypothetical protein|nr:hypothetical protein [Candidatus Woesearchaeota archaeon]MBT6518352.1 hypothetical protein [Candidatus Woesearchaeota archaeon]MBT7366649.1 hypothetical protein [Candidatus Woesearchaeota archaeon]
MSLEDIGIYKVLAATIGAVVERKALAESLESVGLTKDELVNECLAPQSSEVAREYMAQTINKKMGAMISEDEDLYVIKKIACAPEHFESIANEVNKKDGEKYNRLFLMSDNYELINCKNEGNCFEVYLVGAQSDIEALEKVEGEDPIFNMHGDINFVTYINQLDSLVEKCISNHTEQDIINYFELMQEIIQRTSRNW